MLHSFNVGGDDNTGPEGPLIFDESGNIYGTAGGGDPQLFGRLRVRGRIRTFTSGEQARNLGYANLYAFQGGNDGINPSGYMVFDSIGNLYGTTEAGGGTNGGTAYRLSPPISGEAWSETLLYAFTGSNGDISCPTA